MNDEKRWITWRGRRILVNDKGNIEKKKYNDTYKYVIDDEDGYDKYVEMSDESYRKLEYNEIRNISASYLKTEQSYDINEALRNDEDETQYLDKEDFKNLIKQMDKACLTYTSKEDMASTRFVDMNYLRNAYGLDIKQYGDVNRKEIAEQMKQFIGSTLSSKSYTSISLNESGNGMFNNLAVKMKINLPTGTKMYVADNVGEYEAILGRNTKMQLKDVLFKPSKVQGFENEYGKILLTYEVINNEKR